MDRRSFFTLAGALGLGPIIGPGCGSGSTPTTDPFVHELALFRSYIVPPATEPAMEFRPLRQK